MSSWLTEDRADSAHSDPTTRSAKMTDDAFDALMPPESYVMAEDEALGWLAGISPMRYACLACGAIVFNREVHEEFHRRVEPDLEGYDALREVVRDEWRSRQDLNNRS